VKLKDKVAIMVPARTIVTLLNAVPAPIAAWFRHDALIARALRPVVRRLVPARPTWAVVRSGVARGLYLLIDPRNEKYYWSGTHEVAVQRALAGLLRPGMTFWDVGAHIGFFSLFASRALGPTGRVHAFEPMERNRGRLAAGIEKNRFANVTVHDFALSARFERTMLRAYASSLMWTLVPERGEAEGVTIQCRTLDDCTNAFGAPDVIKIDAEGAEVDVLRGGRRLLSTRRPLLLVEFSDDVLLEEARKLLPFYAFERLGARHFLLHAS
jgi:FkbM family methyltransferase